MATSHGEYRGYLRNTIDMEAGHNRFQSVQTSDSTYRSILFGTLVVMGLLQVASSIAILLHLTGYLQEIDLSMAPHQPIEEIQVEPVLNALKDTRKRRCKTPRESLPSAHLPITAHQMYSKTVAQVVDRSVIGAQQLRTLSPESLLKLYALSPFDHVEGEPNAVTIIWDQVHGYRHRMGYQKGKLLVMESGFYYVYAKTCFRYYKYLPEDSIQVAVPTVDVSNTQLIQYIFHESIKQNSKAVVLMKTGSTMRWNNTSYNMYCAQQGRGVRLEEGDALFVNVSNAWMLDPEGEGTYFGAIKLGN